MSRLSGKCDLYDHVYSIGTKGTDDSMTKKEKFEIFKRRTGGVLHQAIKVPVTKFNIDFLVKNNSFLKKLDSGHYEYCGKEYKTWKSLKEVSYTREIHFETMMDLVPYLSHIITVMASDEGGEYVEISTHPFPYNEYLESLKFGYECSNTLEWFNKQLVKEYIETAESFLKELEGC